MLLKKCSRPHRERSDGGLRFWCPIAAKRLGKWSFGWARVSPPSSWPSTHLTSTSRRIGRCWRSWAHFSGERLRNRSGTDCLVHGDLRANRSRGEQDQRSKGRPNRSLHLTASAIVLFRSTCSTAGVLCPGGR